MTGVRSAKPSQSSNSDSSVFIGALLTGLLDGLHKLVELAKLLICKVERSSKRCPALQGTGVHTTHLVNLVFFKLLSTPVVTFDFLGVQLPFG